MKALEIFKYFFPGLPEPILFPSILIIGITPFVELVTQTSSAERK